MRLKQLSVLPAVLISVLLFSSCGGGKADRLLAPELESYAVESSNAGEEDSQRVTVLLRYDRPVRLKKDAERGFRITVGGTGLPEKALTVSYDAGEPRQVKLEMAVTTVTSGTLTIRSAGETDMVETIVSAEKGYASLSPDISCLIPTGVTLETREISSGDGTAKARVVKAVTGRFHIRGILWIRLLENGRPAPPPEHLKSETLDGAMAVHGHDFLSETEENIAEEIAGILAKAYGDRYAVSAEGTCVTVESRSDEVRTVDLEIYLY